MSLTEIQFPKDLFAWVEAHNGLASLAQAVGVIVSLWLTQHIASREQREQRHFRDSYRNLLRKAFTNLREPIAYPDAVTVSASAHAPARAKGPPEETAKQLSSAIKKMEDALAVIREIEDVNKVDNFKAILAIIDLRRKIEGAMPTFKKEQAWLQEHGTNEKVVGNAVVTLAGPTYDLHQGINVVVSALDHPLH
jgi:hypothetical protein